MTNTAIINLEAFKNTPLNDLPFPYLVVPNFLRLENIAKVMADYPKINYHGSVPLEQLKYGDGFQCLIDELMGDELRSAIAEKFAINLDGRPIMITARGKTRHHDGQIHTDSKSKLITVLLYMNEAWTSTEGQLRLLKNGTDIDDYVTEIPPLLGTCLFFRVTDNCWHGHKTFIGERRAIQMNYVTDEAAVNKHISRHNFTAKLKRLKQWFGRSEY